MAGDATVTTPIVPVVVGDDWKAVYLWRALYDAGVFVNVALHPAVPPAGALLRTSVMATHDTATLDLRAGPLRGGQDRLRGGARAAAGALSGLAPRPLGRGARRPADRGRSRSAVFARTAEAARRHAPVSRFFTHPGTFRT